MKKEGYITLNVLKDNGFVIDTKKNLEILPFLKGQKIKFNFVCNSIFYTLPTNRLEIVTYVYKYNN